MSLLRYGRITFGHRVNLVRCDVCEGSTLGFYGEQCRRCHGKGVVYRAVEYTPEAALAYRLLGKSRKRRA